MSATLTWPVPIVVAGAGSARGGGGRRGDGRQSNCSSKRWSCRNSRPASAPIAASRPASERRRDGIASEPAIPRTRRLSSRRPTRRSRTANYGNSSFWRRMVNQMKRITNSAAAMTAARPATDARLANEPDAHPTPAPVRRSRRSGAICLGGQHDRRRQRLAPGLHIVATPIGNLGDITLRALETLAAADLIACEDTRVTRKLLDRYGIATPLTPYHDHNAARRGRSCCARLADGAAIALVSDAGTPLISDPGYKLVRAAQEAGHAVTALPGASAVLAALTVAGLPTDRFFFAGFLPPKQAARRTRIAELARVPATLVLFESGPRIAADARRSRGRAGSARGRHLPRTDQAARGSPPRRSRGAGAKLCGGGESRGEIVIVIAPPRRRRLPSADDIDDAAARKRWRASRSRTRSARSPPRPAAAPRGLSARAGAGQRSRRWRAALNRRAAPPKPRTAARSAWRRSARRLGGKPRRHAADRQGLSHRGAALENAARRDRHRRPPPPRSGLRRSQGARDRSTMRPRSVTERNKRAHRRRRRNLARAPRRRRTIATSAST